MKKLTSEDRERMRRVDEEGLAARENMQRILDDIGTRRRELQERAARRGLWSRIVGSRPA